MGPAANKATSFAGRLSATCCSSSYHDGQFWVGLAEHVEDGRHGVARIVFGAEPSDEEILRFVVDKWEKLSFFGDEAAETSKPAKNPKRYAHEVSKALKQPAMGTKAQQALAAQREAMKQESAHARSRRRVDADGDCYARARARHRTS
ncbi:YjdF family protein [Collinsella stercoris]|uniref:YjdF family protein n=1 Tax=Collinsella stercoris TaxID=147206 RepID=UPI002ECA1982|nr:YjdF family protein [Collinsella sp.]